ncbi:MAG: hypothetical protein OWT28_08985 [Firmicutes bacterium]|nr:hypothetical protein [Bacillota bacterium]
MSPIRSILLYTLSFLITTTLVTGCGFVDVSSLTASAAKEGIAIVGPSSVLNSGPVASAMRRVPRGLSVVPINEGTTGDAELARLLSSASLAGVIALEPSAKMQRVVSRYPSVHFFFVGLPQATKANVTWLTPTVSDLSASYAGYVAGRVSAPNSVIAAVYSGSVETPSQSTLMAGIRSGMNAAYSTASLLPASSAQASSVVQHAAALIILGRSPSWTVLGTPLTIALANESGAQFQLPTGTLLSVSLDSIWNTGIHANWPSLAPVSLPLPAAVSPYTNAANAAAVATYAHDLQQGVLLPAQFVTGPPSLTEAKALHLPFQ